MKKYTFIFIILLLCLSVSSQTLIGTSNYYGATAHPNQRKIVRDINENLYVVYTDQNQEAYKIMGLTYLAVYNEWSEAEFIVNGLNPTLSIGFDERIHLVYESDDDHHKIMHSATDDFENWTNPLQLSNSSWSCRHPVADIDSMGALNIFWIEDDGDDGDDNLIYCLVMNDSVLDRKEIISKFEIYDVSIANHLQYSRNDLFFGISFFVDTVQFFHSTDYLNTIDTLYESNGISTCISYNSLDDYASYYSQVRLLYSDFTIWEVQTGYPNYLNTSVNQMPYNSVGYLCVDNLTPPIGYSFLFTQDDILKHGFSYGPQWDFVTIMSTIQGNDNINYPSIAYKHFNPLFVDFIWMVDNGAEYSIYHLRDDKHVWMPGIEDTESGKGFSITGKPNPFSEQITIHVVTEQKDQVPFLEIYNTNSQLIREIHRLQTNTKEYIFTWDGRHQNGNYAIEGIYIVMCTVGDKRSARKIIYKP